MTRDDDFIGQLEGYLDEYEGMTPLPHAVRDAIRAELPTTRQIGWFGRPVRRFQFMNNNVVRVGVAAAAVIVVAIVGYSLLRGPTVGNPPAETPTPSASGSTTPLALFTSTPFAPGGFGMCGSLTAECTEDPRDDAMTFTFQAPDDWEGIPGAGDKPSGVALVGTGSNAPDGAMMLIHRGSWLYSQPCRPDDESNADIPVGPSVDDFANALDSHPLLDVTPPVDVTLAGYSGKYTEVQLPAGVDGCVRYRPIEGTIYAQGASNRWRFWILDVGGVRVVIQTADYAGTSAQHQAELQAIVESIQIQP